jgi:hypothetical protein
MIVFMEGYGGKGPARGEATQGGQGPDAEPGCVAAEPYAGERGGQAGCQTGLLLPCRTMLAKMVFIGRSDDKSGRPSAGVDGMTVAKYEKGLTDNIRDLCGRVHTGRYRPCG